MYPVYLNYGEVRALYVPHFTVLHSFVIMTIIRIHFVINRMKTMNQTPLSRKYVAIKYMDHDQMTGWILSSKPPSIKGLC